MFDCKTLDEFLSQWGDELGKEADRAMAPLHIPKTDPVNWLLPLNRKPFPGQAHSIAAAVKVLNRQNSVGLIWEQGSGKTLGATALVHNHANCPPVRRWHKKNPEAAPAPLALRNGTAPYRALVMCPGHLPRKWKREIENTIPGVRVTILESFADVAALTRHDETPAGAHWFVIGKDRAKLSCAWRAGVVVCKWHKIDVCRCPKCHAIQKDIREDPRSFDYFEKARRQCDDCGEPLWQDVPVPRNKYSPALFIKKKLKKFFDYLVVDEQQDMKGADTVQADAMGFLSAACKKTVTLTGTLVGGYAWHVRTTLFRIGAAASLVESGFGWKDEQSFNERYGRIETKITHKGAGDGEGHRQAKGKKSSRTVVKTVRPGIMPTLFGDHLISSNIFLSLDEVCADLPRFDEEIVSVEMDADVKASYVVVENALRDAIKALMFKKGGRGLMGTLLQTLLAYPDYPFEWKEIGYHDEITGLWMPIVTPPSYEMNRRYKKEEALLERIKSELAQGRKCWVFTTMVEKRDAISRIERMLRQEGITATVLRASVDPQKREDWIDKEGPRNQVILSHPELVKTGLDFFDSAGRYNFPTIMFYMTGYNSFTLSQASRRAWRIGQRQVCKVMYFFARDTMQETCMTLMGKKMAATSAVSGRFSTEGLAAMAGDDDNLEMAMAKALVENTGRGGEALRVWDKIVAPPALVPPPSGFDQAAMMKAIDRMETQWAAEPVKTPIREIAKVKAAIAPRVVPVISYEQADLWSLLDDPSAFEELPS
jgi:SNF2 family DNA or RNA helicase